LPKKEVFNRRKTKARGATYSLDDRLKKVSSQRSGRGKICRERSLGDFPSGGRSAAKNEIVFEKNAGKKSLKEGGKRRRQR